MNPLGGWSEDKGEREAESDKSQEMAFHIGGDSFPRSRTSSGIEICPTRDRPSVRLTKDGT